MPKGIPKVFCKAKKSNGEPCGNAPIRGGTVCRYHGGAAPAVIAAARVRLAMASRSAVDVLVDMLKDESVAPRDRIKAATEVLSRTGINQGIEVQMNVRTYEDVLDAVLVDVEEDGDDFDGPNEVVYDEADVLALDDLAEKTASQRREKRQTGRLTDDEERERREWVIRMQANNQPVTGSVEKDPEEIARYRRRQTLVKIRKEARRQEP